MLEGIGNSDTGSCTLFSCYNFSSKKIAIRQCRVKPVGIINFWMPCCVQLQTDRWVETQTKYITLADITLCRDVN